MRRLVAGLAGIVLFALAVAAFVPASMVDARLAARTGAALRVAQAQGTVWNGRGVLTASDGSWRMPLTWRIAPLSLARGVIDVTLTPVDPAADAPRGRVQLERDRLRAEGIAFTLPARALAALTRGHAALAGGDVEVRADAVALALENGTGGVVAQWDNARLHLPGQPVVDLGTVSARLGVRGNELRGPIASRGGQVSVSGELALGVSAHRVDLELAPEPSASPAVRAMLAALGPGNARGAVKLRVDRGAR